MENSAKSNEFGNIGTFSSTFQARSPLASLNHFFYSGIIWYGKKLQFELAPAISIFCIWQIPFLEDIQKNKYSPLSILNKSSHIQMCFFFHFKFCQSRKIGFVYASPTCIQGDTSCCKDTLWCNCCAKENKLYKSQWRNKMIAKLRICFYQFYQK